MVPPRSNKHQAPTSKHQRNAKLQSPKEIPNPQQVEAWNLELLWSLEFGIRSFLWVRSLGFGVSLTIHIFFQRPPHHVQRRFLAAPQLQRFGALIKQHA